MASIAVPHRKRRSESGWALAWRRLRKHKLAMMSLLLLSLLILMALFAPVIAPHDPVRQPRGANLSAQFFQPPSAQHWLGTDELGRDVLSRLIYGSRVSLLVGFLAATSSVLIGTLLGAIAGFFSGRPVKFFVGPLRRDPQGWTLPFGIWRVISWGLYYGALYLVVDIAWSLAGPGVTSAFGGERGPSDLWSVLGFGAVVAVVAFVAVWGLRGAFRLDFDIVISRVIDFMLTLPGLPILLVLSALLRDPQAPFGRWTQSMFGEASSVFIIVFILVLFGWISTARLVRGAFLSLREMDFTAAAQALGVSNTRVMFRHLVPNSLAPIIVDGTLAVGVAILVEAALSFLGFGIQPPVSTWGNMLNNAQTYIFFAPWLALWPGFMIVITVLSINFLGDGLRDAFDPRHHR